jgi:ribosomal protein S18 acetylase RimI-like enzyme
MAIRKLDSHDAGAYQRLRLQALRECPTAFSASYEDEVGRSELEIVARVKPSADGSFCIFGAFVDDRLAGFLAFIGSQRAKLRHCAQLAGMYVAPEFRRGGAGRALLDAAIEHARCVEGIRQLKLSVNATNNSARHLYRTAGFERFGTEPDALFVDGRYHDEELYILPIASRD